MPPSASSESRTIDLAKEMGAKIFGMCVDVVEGKGSHPKGPARYDYRRDRIDLFVSYIDQFCEEHDDRKALITYAICHEAGHASETRSLERGVLFPYGLNVSRRLPALVRSEFGISLYPEDLDMAMNQVLNGVLDYCVDRKLDANGMKDVAAKAVIPQVKLELQKRKSGSYKAGLDKFNALTNLPLRIVSYFFGQLDGTERAILEEYYRHDDLPDKWRTSRKLLESCEFGNANRLIETVEKTYYEMFGICASVKSTKRELLEARYVGGKLPDFWKAGEYFVFSLV